MALAKLRANLFRYLQTLSSGLRSRPYVKYSPRTAPQLLAAGYQAGGQGLSAPRQSAWKLALFAGPSMSLNTMLVPLLLLLPAFYSIEVGLDVAVIGNIFMFARVWDAITDPTIGALSDRTRTRWGRRRPWLIGALPLTLLATWFLLNPPADAGYLWLGLWLFLFYVFWTAMFIPYQSWGAELATDFDERTRVAGYRDGASFLGYLLAALLPLLVLQVFMGIEAPSYGQMLVLVGLFFAITLPVSTLLCVWRVTEPKPVETRPISWNDLFGIVVRNRPFQRLFVAYLFDRVGMGVYFAVMPLLIPLGLGLGKYFLALSVAISIASLAFSPVWVRIAGKLGKHPSYCLANVVSIIAYAMFLWVPVGSQYWALLTFIVLGIGNAGTLITAPSMMADCVDYDHLESGVEQTGAHMACLWLITKIGFAMGIGIGLNFIGLYGFDGQAAIQSDSAVTALRIGTGGIPMLLLVPAILIMLQFPLGRRRHAEIRRQLEARGLDGG